MVNKKKTWFSFLSILFLVDGILHLKLTSLSEVKFGLMMPFSHLFICRGLLWYPSIRWSWNSSMVKESGNYVQSTNNWCGQLEFLTSFHQVPIHQWLPLQAMKKIPIHIRRLAYFHAAYALIRDSFFLEVWDIAKQHTGVVEWKGRYWLVAPKKIDSVVHNLSFQPNWLACSNCNTEHEVCPCKC